MSIWWRDGKIYPGALFRFNLHARFYARNTIVAYNTFDGWIAFLGDWWMGGQKITWQNYKWIIPISVETTILCIVYCVYLIVVRYPKITNTRTGGSVYYCLGIHHMNAKFDEVFFARVIRIHASTNYSINWSNESN